ncbi:hypothetical protein ACEN2J_19420 [Pseudorhodobacter sp. W20_MBD10_FR17]|uniref:hypothetical protein n=1 Tax=Pseudorhodobacter sp. W20_MBD10_FR17 TaxID=3240266 RepID=UPI003F98D334
MVANDHLDDYGPAAARSFLETQGRDVACPSQGNDLRELATEPGVGRLREIRLLRQHPALGLIKDGLPFADYGKQRQ